MRLLELFSGTGSIGKAFRLKGVEVISLDLDPKAQATHTADILEWDYRQYPPGHFQVVWGSPVCTHYSRARTNAKTPRDLVGSDLMVAKLLEIIAYFQPQCWLFENPGSGLLKTRPIVGGIPYKAVTYCKYGYPYRKLTYLWHSPSLSSWTPRPPCSLGGYCQHMVGRRHPRTAQRAPGKVDGCRVPGDSFSQSELYSMPPELCEAIAEACLAIVGPWANALLQNFSL